MGKRLLMGNEAIALGALRAGVTVVAGYPGTPSSEVIETIVRERPDGVYVEWSVNEKAALEVCAGAAISGARALVTMKQVGLNVASDPLMSLNYVGVKGGMVVMVADDPGPISSQTEQDTRSFGLYAKLAVFDPSTPEEAYAMAADAFECSERLGRPVILRPTTRVCHGYASVTIQDALPARTPGGFEKERGRWVIFPRLAYANHVKIEAALVELAGDFSSYPGNSLSGSGGKGIAAGGVSWRYVGEALKGLSSECRLLKVSTVPVPARLGTEFLSGLDEVLVVEELDPVIERELIFLCGRHGLDVRVRGKLSGDIPNAGENTPSGVEAAIRSFLGERAGFSSVGEGQPSSRQASEPLQIPALPVRPPVLCAGCPHRASFFAVKEAAAGRKAVFSGDIGCYTLGNALPLDMVDTCLCMGAGITMAQGIKLVDPDCVNFAFIGDSTLFHSGIPGIVNAIYNKTDVIVAVLDNSTTAMTGGQPHPGVGRKAAGSDGGRVPIIDVLKAIGVDDLQRVNAFDFAASKAAAKRALEKSGVRLILFEGECVALSRGPREICSVDEKRCVGCSLCLKKLGCPAITIHDKRAEIDPVSCTGCGLCKVVCAAGAIEGGDAA
ncbi:MAG: indolepyruvate ferredoxin oxidoreductase subunit alpha [Synergistaceae bacterium]|jgi:indolepyruvate ferredoxin oxidoreductase alpha subunit|nr:indolepyruvate ferredoxin oxidoreductase subunit alpha [Synergistaceae bacterium]